MSSLSLFVLPLVATLTAAPPAGKGEVAITWLGHATFEIVSPGGTKILIDPFLTDNPATPADRKKLDDYKPDAILLSHSHFDHTADAVAIATKSGAKVIGAFDHLTDVKVPDAQKVGGNVGGKIKVSDDVTVHLVPAMHGSEPGGRPIGFIIELPGRSIYHTGDTWLFGDMALIQEIYKPSILLFQAGGGPYNQDPKTAALAIKKYFKPKTIIPMHFGTWPVLASEEEVTAAFKNDKRLRVMKPGDTVKL